MNLFLSSDLTTNYNTLDRLEEELDGCIDFSKCTIYTTDSIIDRIFLDYAIVMGSEVRVIKLSPFLIDPIVASLSNVLQFLIFFSTLDNNFYRKLFEACDLKDIPIRVKRHSWSSYTKEG